MTLEQRLALILAGMHENGTLSKKDCIPLIDLTLLDPHASAQDVENLANKANKYHVAAVCVYPEHLHVIPVESRIKRATVVNFPEGEDDLANVLTTIRDLTVSTLIDEIDYVFPYKTYLAGEQQKALHHCHEVFLACKQHKLTFKVILETGALPSIDFIYNLSKAVISNGCDFLKTSTGKFLKGATIPAVFAMLAAIADSNSTCGVKVSGGIKTPEQAFSYMTLAMHMLNRPLDNTWFRIGASSLLDALMSEEAHLKAHY